VTPGGVVLDPFYVLRYPDWTVAIALTAADEMVVIRQYRHGIGSVGLEFPGGCIDAEDPSPLTAGMRELLEETGYGGGSGEYLGRFPANPAMQNNYMHVVLVRDATKLAEPQLDHGEEIAVETIPVADVMELAVSGGLSQSMHVAALFIAMRALGRLHY